MLDLIITATEIALVAVTAYRFASGLVKLWKECKPSQPVSIPQAPFSPTPQLEPVIPDVSDPWEGKTEHLGTVPLKLQARHFSPVLALPQAKPVKPNKTTKKDYNKLNVPQLRKECTLQKINWKNGGDYGKPMKKLQMIKALA